MLGMGRSWFSSSAGPVLLSAIPKAGDDGLEVLDMIGLMEN